MAIVTLDFNPSWGDHENTETGTVRVDGTAKVEQVTSLIDALKRGRQAGWLVLAHGRAAFVRGSTPTAATQPIWICTDGTVKLFVDAMGDNDLHLGWPTAKACLYLEPAECAIATRQSRKFS
jgi:hypothetical protein